MYFDIGLYYIAKVIHNLYRNKAHGHEISSIHMPEAAAINSIYKPLTLSINLFS